MINIRNVRKSDLDLICNFFKSEKELHYAFPYASFPLTKNQLEEVIFSRSDPTVLTENDIPVGFCDFYNIINGEECYIGNFVIDKNYRKTGLSKKMLSEMTGLAVRFYDVKKVKVICWCENADALLLYCNFDFKPEELIIRDFDSKKVPVLLLEKNIDRAGNF